MKKFMDILPWMQEQGYSQRALAEKLGCSVVQLKRILQGESRDARVMRQLLEMQLASQQPGRETPLYLRPDEIICGREVIVRGTLGEVKEKASGPEATIWFSSTKTSGRMLIPAHLMERAEGHDRTAGLILQPQEWQPGREVLLRGFIVKLEPLVEDIKLAQLEMLSERGPEYKNGFMTTWLERLQPEEGYEQ